MKIICYNIFGDKLLCSGILGFDKRHYGYLKLLSWRIKAKATAADSAQCTGAV